VTKVILIQNFPKECVQDTDNMRTVELSKAV